MGIGDFPNRDSKQQSHIVKFDERIKQRWFGPGIYPRQVIPGSSYV